MNLDAELHALAGSIAFVLGAGALWRGPRLLRNRLFAGLCAALAAWNLGVALPPLLGRPTRELELLYLLGGCFAPALALHFSCVGGLARGLGRSLLIALAYSSAAGLWLAAALGARSHGPAWALVAIGLLGTLLSLTLALFLRRLLALPRGPARAAHWLLLATAVLAAAAGLSDLVPREAFPRLGPLLLLPFLFVLCAVVLRHRFLDLDDFLARAVALGLGAAMSSVLVRATVHLAGGPRLLPIFAVCLLVLSAAGPVGRLLLRRTRRLWRSTSVDVRALEAASRRLAGADGPAALWAELEAARLALDPGLGVRVHLEAPDGRFRPAASLGPGRRPPELDADSGLPALLRSERAPLSPRVLAEDARLGSEARRRASARAAEDLALLGAELVAPLSKGERLVGWIALTGLAEERITGELAAALAALGAQALATLEALEARQVARRSEAFAAVGELAAGLAHEVRNPVSAIRGAAQVLQEARDAEQEREMLEVIAQETERLGRVVGEFLDYARPDSPRREAVDLAAVLRSVVREARAAGHGMATELELPSDLPPALGDPDQLHRAFANLVRNAFEAAGPVGRLRIEAGRAESGMIELRFEDDGPGVAPEEVERVFQPFHTTRPAGTGLGLALVRRVLESQGGDIRLDPRPGLGAAFILRLPAASPSPRAAATSPRAAATSP